jgi:hypothetical protein
LSILRSAVCSWVRIKYCWVRIFLNQYLLVAGMQTLVKRARLESVLAVGAQVAKTREDWCPGPELMSLFMISPSSAPRQVYELLPVFLIFQCYLFGLCSCAMCFFPFLHFFVDDTKANDRYTCENWPVVIYICFFLSLVFLSYY